jgi:hypothetical protein
LENGYLFAQRCQMPATKSQQTHRDFTFGHTRNPRVEASVVLIGVVAVLIGSVFVAIGPSLKTSALAAHTESGGSRLGPVRVVGISPREDVPCEQQTWPSIDQRCLASVKVESRSGSRSPETQADDAKLSPLTATGTAMESPPDTRDDNIGGSLSEPPPSPARDSLNVTVRSGATAGFVNDETQYLPSQFPPEPTRKRARHHFGFPFGIRF